MLKDTSISKIIYLFSTQIFGKIINIIIDRIYTTSFLN